MDLNLSGFSRREVIVIDTSCKGWKFEKILFRKKSVWKVRDRKGNGMSFKRNNKMKMKRKLSVDEEEEEVCKKKKKKKKKKKMVSGKCSLGKEGKRDDFSIGGLGFISGWVFNSGTWASILLESSLSMGGLGVYFRLCNDVAEIQEGGEEDEVVKFSWCCVMFGGGGDVRCPKVEEEGGCRGVKKRGVVDVGEAGTVAEDKEDEVSYLWFGG